MFLARKEIISKHLYIEHVPKRSSSFCWIMEVCCYAISRFFFVTNSIEGPFFKLADPNARMIDIYKRNGEPCLEMKDQCKYSVIDVFLNR